jgi:hypothetical protein
MVMDSIPTAYSYNSAVSDILHDAETAVSICDCENGCSKCLQAYTSIRNAEGLTPGSRHS